MIFNPLQTEAHKPNVNFYQNKKSFGTGMIDFALLVTNVRQLKNIMSFKADDLHFYYASTFLLLTSIVLQIILGIVLADNCQYDVRDSEEICKSKKCNNRATVLIYLITAINVIISALGIAEIH